LIDVEPISVLIILGLLGSLVTLGIASQMKKHRIRKAAEQVAQLNKAVESFQRDRGTLPSSLRNLAPTYLAETSLVDPWTNSFRFTAPGKHDGHGFDLWSYGPDGKDGTADDIRNSKGGTQ